MLTHANVQICNEVKNLTALFSYKRKVNSLNMTYTEQLTYTMSNI